MRSIIYQIFDIIQVNSLNFSKNKHLNFFNYFVVTKKNFYLKNFFNNNTKKSIFKKKFKNFIPVV